ncbi:MAG: CopD family protein [Thaumarchaeota archaeon]|nr:CopD family protein [Nitrososphaerota archaeon]
MPPAFAHEQEALIGKYKIKFNVIPDEPSVGKIAVPVVFTYKVELVDLGQEVQINLIRINITSPSGNLAQHLYQGDRAFHIMTEAGQHKVDAVLTLADGTILPTNFLVAVLQEGSSTSPFEMFFLSLSVFGPISLIKAVHIGAAAIWIGTSFHTFLVVRSPDNGSKISLMNSKYGNALLYTTTFAVGIVVSTGLINAIYKHRIDFDSLVNTAYGLTLFVKMLAVIPVLIFGGLIEFRYLPRLRSPNSGRMKNQAILRLKTLLIAELSLFALIVFVATVFTALHPSA